MNADACLALFLHFLQGRHHLLDYGSHFQDGA